MQALRIRRIEEFHQPRQAPGRGLERQSASQRLIQIGGLAHRRPARRDCGGPALSSAATP